MNIHPTAIVDSKAELGTDVVIGPYSIIDAHVVIGDRVVIGPHVHITGHTTIGEDCAIHTGVVLGGPPQDRKYAQEVSYLRVGHRNIIREFVTMHLAVGEGNATVIGDDNMLMAYAHIAHNCVVGNHRLHLRTTWASAAAARWMTASYWAACPACTNSSTSGAG